MTRSFGDVDFKVPAEVVTAVPELSAFAIDPEAGRGGDLRGVASNLPGILERFLMWCVHGAVSTGRDSRFDLIIEGKAKPDL